MLIVAYHDWLMGSANNLLRDQAWSHIYCLANPINTIVNSREWE